MKPREKSGISRMNSQNRSVVRSVNRTRGNSRNNSRNTSRNTSKNTTRDNCRASKSTTGQTPRKERKTDILVKGDLVQLNKLEIKVKDILGRGGFGQVYHVQNSENPSQSAALKIEPQKTGIRLLFESMLLSYIHNSKGGKEHFPLVFRYGVITVKDMRYRYCLFQILGTTLSDLRRQYTKDGKHFEEKTIAHITLQTFKAISDFHSYGFGHHDVKPQNFVCGRAPHESRIYLIDYGIGRYCFEGDKFIRPKSKYHFTGTLKYCAINSHNRKHPDQKDDIESWVYMMFELYDDTSLMWTGRDNPEKILRGKKIFLQDCSYAFKRVPQVLGSVVDFASSPEYGMKPNHSAIYKELEQYFTKANLIPCEKVEWENKYENLAPFDIPAQSLNEEAIQSLKFDDWDPKNLNAKTSRNKKGSKVKCAPGKTSDNDENIEQEARKATEDE